MPDFKIALGKTAPLGEFELALRGLGAATEDATVCMTGPSEGPFFMRTVAAQRVLDQVFADPYAFATDRANSQDENEVATRVQPGKAFLHNSVWTGFELKKSRCLAATALPSLLVVLKK